MATKRKKILYQRQIANLSEYMRRIGALLASSPPHMITEVENVTYRPCLKFIDIYLTICLFRAFDIALHTTCWYRSSTLPKLAKISQKNYSFKEKNITDFFFQDMCWRYAWLCHTFALIRICLKGLTRSATLLEIRVIERNIINRASKMDILCIVLYITCSLLPIGPVGSKHFNGAVEWNGAENELFNNLKWN
ncbi:hypothetical protein ACJX0J_006125, partial [Zea mays]